MSGNMAAPAVPCWPVSVSSKHSGELPMPRTPVDSMSVGSITYRCPLSVLPCKDEQDLVNQGSLLTGVDCAQQPALA